MGRTHVRIKGQNLNFYYLETHATTQNISFIWQRILPRNSLYYTDVWMILNRASTKYAFTFSKKNFRIFISTALHKSVRVWPVRVWDHSGHFVGQRLWVVHLRQECGDQIHVGRLYSGPVCPGLHAQPQLCRQRHTRFCRQVRRGQGGLYHVFKSKSLGSRCRFFQADRVEILKNMIYIDCLSIEKIVINQKIVYWYELPAKKLWDKITVFYNHIFILSFRSNGYKMTMRSVLKIPKGADILHAYTEPLDTILTRKSLLQLGKFFSCQCPRCLDPTELGTFTSALMCPECKKGSVITSDVANLEAEWTCQKCDFKMKCEKVQRVCRGECDIKWGWQTDVTE